MLDRAALVACWREALLAQKVLNGQTKGYRHHPQLQRFRDQTDPVGAIGTYLSALQAEATNRGYRFDRTKIIRTTPVKIPITTGQLGFELAHLRAKVSRRAPQELPRLEENKLSPHPIFEAIEGEVAPWEKAGPPLSDSKDENN